MAYLAKTFWETDFGKTLAAIVPEGTIRVVIDVSMDEIVVAYYKTYAPKKILDLDWSTVLATAQVVCGDDKYHVEIVKG